MDLLLSRECSARKGKKEKPLSVMWGGDSFWNSQMYRTIKIFAVWVNAKGNRFRVARVKLQRWLGMGEAR